MILDSKAGITLAALAALGLAAAHPAKASTTLVVENGTFMTQGAPIPDFNNFGTNVSSNDGTYGGTGNGVNGSTPPGSSNIAYIGSGNTISQDLSSNGSNPGLVLVAGDTYTFSLYDEDYSSAASSLTYGFYDATSVPASTAPTPSTDLYNETFTPSTTSAGTNVPLTFSFTYTPFAGNAAGDDVGIYFLDDGGGADTPDIDDITASVSTPAISATPEPSQVGMIALMGIGLGGLMLKARKRGVSTLPV